MSDELLDDIEFSEPQFEAEALPAYEPAANYAFEDEEAVDEVPEVVFEDDEVGVVAPLPPQPSMTEEKIYKRAGDNALRAAKGAGRTLHDGYDAIRKVHAAAKEHNSAKQRLKTMRATLDTDSEELKRRDGIMASFDQIIEEETAELNAATELAESLRERKAELAEERRTLNSDLSREKSDNEQALRPYKQLYDTARGRSEDASRAVAEAKRNVKSQEAKVAEAQNRRTQSIASANRELDNSQDRLRRMQDELAKLKAEINPEEGSISSLEADIASEEVRVESARAKVGSVTSELQGEVDLENERLFALRRALDQSTSDAEAAKLEYEERRSEYERLSNAANAREQAIQADIAARTQGISTADAELKVAEERIRDATAIIDDAKDVHDHPEVTEALRASVEAQNAAIDEQTSHIAELARNERSLRQDTRKTRVIFIAVSVVVLVIIVAIIVALIMSGNK